MRVKSDYKNRPKFYIFLFLLLPVVLYLQALNGDFVWDDRTYFIDNDILPNLHLCDFKNILLKPSNYWGELLPVRDLLYVVEYKLFGLNPVGYHLVSLMLYFLLLISCYLFLSAIFTSLKKASEITFKFDRAIVITMLFGVMPLHVEGVAYISGQKDLLFSLFALLSMLFFWKGFNSDKKYLVFISLGVISFFLSVLSKLTGLMLIGIIPVIYLVSPRRGDITLTRFSVLWIVISLPAVLWFFYRHGIHEKIWESTSELTSLPIYSKVVIGIKLLGAHTVLAIKPWPQSFGYPFSYAASVDKNLAIGALALLTIIFLIVRSIKKKDYIILFGVLVYSLFLFPALQMVNTLNNASVYDRYLFLPILGLLIVYENILYSLRRGNLYKGLSVVVLIVYAVLTLNYLPTFKSDVASTYNTLKHYPEWPPASFNYVSSLIEAGLIYEAEAFINEQNHLLRPPWVLNYFKGWIYLKKGMLNKALLELKYSSGLATAGGYFPYPNNLLAKVLIEKGRRDEAIYYLREIMNAKIYNPLEYYRAKILMEKLFPQRESQDKVSGIFGGTK